MQQEIRLQRRAKRSLQCSRDITKAFEKECRCPRGSLCPSYNPIASSDLHESRVQRLYLPYIAPRTSLCFILFCSLLSNLSPCTAPSTVKTLCDSSTRRRLLTTIPANSNQSLRHIPYASACNAVSTSMYLYYAIARSTNLLTTCRETRREHMLSPRVEC